MLFNFSQHLSFIDFPVVVLLLGCICLVLPVEDDDGYCGFEEGQRFEEGVFQETKVLIG